MPHKLLLADDSVTIQRVIELTFADEDIRVIAVGDGRQAIERIQAERPDIVLADIGMPERDGYEVAAFVKSHPDLGHVPVLLLTGAFIPVIGWIVIVVCRACKAHSYSAFLFRSIMESPSFRTPRYVHFAA